MNKPKNSSNKGVIVLGGHVQGYGVIRVFGENNIPSIVIDESKMNIAKHSKFCKKFIHCKYDKLLKTLSVLSKDERYKDWLLIPTDDYYVRILSENRDLLNKHFIVTVDKWNIIKLFFNKRQTYPIAKKVGVPIPETFYPNNMNDIKSISKDVTFPCIVKPAIMLDFYRFFKKKVFVCNNKSELEKNVEKAESIVPINQLLIQEIIPGNSDNQYSAGIFFDKDKSYNYLVAKRKRQHPLDFGNATTFAKTVDLPILIEYAHKILTEAKITGLCEVEFKYDDRDGKYKFLEVNPRTWKWHLISIRAEIPFLLSLYNFMHKSIPIENKNYKESAWQDFVIDLPIILLMKWKKIFIKSKTTKVVQAVFNKNDLKPFLYQCISLPYNLLKR